MHLSVFLKFFCHHCTASTWKFLISCFMKDVSQTNDDELFSYSELGYEIAYIWQSTRLAIMARNLERLGIHAGRCRDIFYLNLSHWRVAEKKTTSGHRIRLLRSRCLKTLLMHQSIPPAPSPPSLPEVLRSICPPCHSRGWGICKFCTTRGPGVCQPWGHFWAFDTNAVSYQNRTTQKFLLEKT